MKISGYTPSPSPQLSDRLIGTDAITLETYNFTILEMLALGSSMYAPNDFGSFIDLTTQSCISGGIKAIELSDTLYSNNISVASASHIVFANAGKYSISMSANPIKNSGGATFLSFWLRVNSIDIPNTTRTFELTATTIPFPVEVTFPVIDADSADYAEIMWTQNGDITINNESENLSVPFPASPSVIVSIDRYY